MISWAFLIEEFSAQTREVLANLGLEIAPGGIVSISDLRKADHGYVHHAAKQGADRPEVVLISDLIDRGPD